MAGLKGLGAALVLSALFPAAIAAHEGKATFIMGEMANYHASLVANANVGLDTAKLVKILLSGGDSKRERDIFAAALPLAQRLGSAGSAKQRLDIYAELTEKLGPLHGFHDESRTHLFYCPMLKKRWIARGEAVSNPFDAGMRTCGTRQP